MLVLNRKEGESVVLTGGITVTLVKIQDGKVQLGFDAPQDVHIVRSELLREQESHETQES
jgi:carbon storage regulator